MTYKQKATRILAESREAGGSDTKLLGLIAQALESQADRAYAEGAADVTADVVAAFLGGRKTSSAKMLAAKVGDWKTAFS